MFPVQLCLCGMIVIKERVVKIINFLWDLEIKSLSLAWEDLYRKAQSDFPDGTITEIDSPFDKGKEIFADPVICRKLLIKNFNDYSKKASEALSNLKIDFTKENFNTLIKYDSILYTILTYWLDDLMDMGSMDPKTFMDNLLEASMDHYLYTLTNPSPRLKQIDNYRLLKL